MNKKLGFIVAATLLGLSAASFADSTEDLINALVAKGILTEDEADVLSKKNVGERHAQEKKIKVSYLLVNTSMKVNYTVT